MQNNAHLQMQTNAHFAHAKCVVSRFCRVQATDLQQERIFISAFSIVSGLLCS